LITPLAMTVEIPDSTHAPGERPAGDDLTTSFTLGGGGGRYVREIGFSGCTSTPPVPVKQEFFDIGGEIDRQTGQRTHIGMRAGYIHDTAHPTAADLTTIEDSLGFGIDRTDDVGYGNVYVSGEWKHVGLGGGALFTTGPLHIDNPDDDPTDDDWHIYPTGHLRFGSLSSFYISGHVFEGVPLYSGGGLFFGGAGWRPVPALEVYGGYSTAGPYFEEGWIGRVTADLNRSWSLQTMLLFPRDYQGNDVDEYGVSAALTYRTYRPGSN